MVVASPGGERDGWVHVEDPEALGRLQGAHNTADTHAAGLRIPFLLARIE
jgi:hypothetical protein